MCSMYHALPPKKRCRIRNVRLLPHPPGAEFGFKLPVLAVRLQRFARPAERIWSDVGKDPTNWCAIAMSADLDDFLAAPAANEFVAATGYRIDPGDTPSLNRWVPDAERGPVCVARLVHVRGALRPWRIDPHVLDSAPFEHPRKMDLPFDAARQKVSPMVMADFQFPASDEPPINICR